MSIMDFFRQPSQQPTQQTQTQQNQNPTTESLGDNPGQTTPIASNPNKPVDPLAAYGKLFEESKDAPEVPPSFKLDPDLIGKTAASLNFMQEVPKELLQAAQSGDTAALMQMMNFTAQKAYQAALAHSSHLTDKFVDSRSKFDMERSLAPRVKSELTQQALQSAPNYSNPVVKEKLNEEARRFQKAYPDATPQEIAKMAQQYIMDLAAALNPTSQQSSKTEDSEEVDWAKYLTQ